MGREPRGGRGSNGGERWRKIKSPDRSPKDREQQRKGRNRRQMGERLGEEIMELQWQMGPEETGVRKTKGRPCR